MKESYQRVYAKVDLDAIRYNMEQMHQKISSKATMIGVIKADGYGHGAVPVGRELEQLKFVSGYAVATAEEAMILRRAKLTKPILVLGYTFPYCYEDMIRNDVRLTVFREDMVKELSACAQKVGKTAKVHIKVDTGMTRIGIRPDESGIKFVRKVLETKGIEPEGIFTHFARADEADKKYAIEQLERFRNFLTLLEEKCGYTIPVKHCSNSAAILELPEAGMDAVRAGIALYGLWPSEEMSRENIILRPALSLKSHIVFVKDVEKGEAVSYGGTYVTPKRMRIATIPVGYGDGYPRGLSNKGYVLIHGKKAPILGRVCMDQFMVSLEEIPDAKEGDAVTLIGADGDEKITMEELGEISGRFNYELACGLGKRIPRVYMKDGKETGEKDYFDDYR